MEYLSIKDMMAIAKVVKVGRGSRVFCGGCKTSLPRNFQCKQMEIIIFAILL